MIIDYSSIIWISLILIPVYSTIMTVLRTIGLEAQAAGVSVFVLLLNAVLTPALIFGVGPVEGMGIAGAAWATVLAQSVALGLTLLIMVRQAPQLNVMRLSNLVWWPALYWKLFIIGLPIGVLMIVYNLENVLIANLVLDYPVYVSDGFGIGARIFGLLRS